VSVSVLETVALATRLDVENQIVSVRMAATVLENAITPRRDAGKQVAHVKRNALVLERLALTTSKDVDKQAVSV